MPKIPYIRWWIGALLFLISILNYIDRQSLALLIPTIQSDLHMSDQQYGNVVSLFLMAYAVSYFISGWLVDKLGARIALFLFLTIWAGADMLSGLAGSVLMLGVARFFLGLGEAGGYSTSPKVVSEWFPAKERGIVVGLYSMGSAIGATVAPILVLWVASRYSWRGALVATGVLALAVAIGWLLFYRTPARHPLITDKESQFLKSLATPDEDQAAALRGVEVWKMILTNRVVWTLMLARMLTDPVWYFFLFWLPKYLHSARGFDQQHLAQTWKIYLTADIGFLFSGFASAWLIKRNVKAPAARRSVMLFAVIFFPLAPLIATSGNLFWVFAVAMLIAFAHTTWLGSLSTYIVDLVPRPILGTTFGFIGAGSALGGLAMNQGVTWAISQFSYTPCFYTMTVLHPLAFALIWLFTRREWKISTPTR